jgi:hypothetical protein
MSAIWKLRESGGKQWFAGWELPMMWHVEHASVIIPADQIEGLSDKAIGRMVRNAIRDATFGAAEFDAEQIMRYRERFPKDRLTQSARACRPRLLEFAGTSELIDDALHVISEDEQWDRIQKKPASRATPRDRSGYIYLVEGQNCYKIGKSVDVPARTRSFGLLLPFKTKLIHFIPTSDMVWSESYLHGTFAHCRLNGEWFDLSPEEVAWICSLRTIEPQA